MQTLINSVNQFFSGPIMVGGLLFVGVILTFKNRFIQFRKLPYTFSYIISSMLKKQEKGNGITPFQALTTALAGTLGTGNIAGVATAIVIGGPGALFWMWVSAFLGMATKYSEIVLSMKFRKRTRDGYQGGPMYYMEKATKGKGTAIFFAGACLLSSFFMGNMVQANTVSSTLSAVFGWESKEISIFFLILAFVVGLVILGGIKRIAKLTEAVIPIMALFYMGSCIIILVQNYQYLPKVFLQIFSSAFCFEGAVGGIVGYGMIQAIRIGFTRGIFTNEAGLGSAPIAHAAADNESPAHQGLWGIFEVMLDTVVMCTLTGLVIILSGNYLTGQQDGAFITIHAFGRYLGGFSAFLIGVSTVFFAVATIISWSYYGETCIRYLSSSFRSVRIYKICYIAAVYLGGVGTADFVWGAADICNGLMMLPNLVCLLLLANEVQSETRIFDKSSQKNRKKLSQSHINLIKRRVFRRKTKKILE